jgi:hypothetical protein
MPRSESEGVYENGDIKSRKSIQDLWKRAHPGKGIG